jgi:DNA polymerase III epsilon subunit-like protein
LKEKNGRKLVLVAHNARNFDCKFLSSELSRVDSSAHGTSLARAVGVDTLLDSLDIVKERKAWALSPNGEPKKKNMTVLYSHVRGGEQILNAHNALSDVLALEEILESDALARTWRHVGRDLLFELFMGIIRFTVIWYQLQQKKTRLYYVSTT